MTMKHRMLLVGLLVCLATRTLVGQDAAPTPAEPPPPPLIPAPEATPVLPPPTPAPSATAAPAAKKSDKKADKKKVAPAKKASAPRPPVADLHPGEAVAMEKNVNVRGQAAINSEIVTHLKRGDVVTVLEQVNLKKAGADEPAKWAKVSLPSDATVWIHAGFIDPSSKAVKPTKLNLRSGPGENFSILGRIERGTVVKEVETKGEWIKIEAPASAHAFIAAHLLSQDSAILASARSKASPKLAASDKPKTVEKPTQKPVEKPVETVAVATSPAVTTPEPLPTPTPAVPAPAPVTPTPTPAPTEVVQTQPVAVPPPPPAAAPEVTPAPAETVVPAEEPLIKRVVTREGMVRGSASIQAPTYFVLRSLDNNKTINYLHAVDTNMVLRAFQHQRVIVTGEEILDERWPNTPVIDVETIEPVP